MLSSVSEGRAAVMKKIKHNFLSMIMISVICLGILSGCGVDNNSVVEQIQEKGQLSDDDIVALAKARNLDLTEMSDEQFDEKWSFVKCYTTNDGDILLLSSYDGDLFYRNQKAWELGWIDYNTSFINAPEVVQDAVFAFGKEGDYAYRSYAAKNILVYFIADGMSDEADMDNQDTLLIEGNDKNFKITDQMFLHDINELTRGNREGTSAHCQMKLEYECYSTPVYHGKYALYDEAIAYMATLSFDEVFFEQHENEMITVVINGPYSNSRNKHISPLYSNPLYIWGGPKKTISGEEHSEVQFNVKFILEESDEDNCYEEVMDF